MPILEYNNLGEIVENNGQGGIKSAQSVQDDNMLKLSIVEDSNILRDREALKVIQKQKDALAKKKWADAVELKAKQAVHKAQTEERKHLLKKKLSFLNELKKNTKLAQAVAQSGANSYYEKMSGVTGYGLTNDGHIPQFSSANLDYQQIVDVDSTFGAYGSFGGSDVPTLIKPVPSVLTSTEITTFHAIAKPDNILRESGKPDFPFVYRDELEKAISNPNYLDGFIDMNEYRLAKERGWGNTGFYYNEGRDNIWWPLKVVFHPHMIFFKRVPAFEGKAVVPRINLAMRGYIMQLGKIYDRVAPLGRLSEFAYKDEVAVAPSVQAVTPVVQAIAPTPAQTPTPVQQIVKQEQQIVKAIEQIEKQVEAQIKTEEKVAEMTKPQAVPVKAATDYRHPMLAYGLLAKKEIVKKEEPLSKTFTVFGVK